MQPSKKNTATPTSLEPSTKPQPLGPEKLKALAERTGQAFLQNLRVASLMSQEPPSKAKN